MRSLLLLLPFGALGVAALHPSDDPKPLTEKPSGAKAVAKPLYAKDVAPILNRACVSCHQAGEVAPFSLTDYATAKTYASTIAAVTKTKRMPPWKAAPGEVAFQHENRLSDGEIETLANWAATGMPRGDKRAEPAPPKPLAGGWSLGKPDMVLEPKETYKLEAEGADVYRNFVIENPSSEPIFVRAMDVHPGNKKTVHHVIVYVDGMHKGRTLAAGTHDGKEGYVSSGGGVGFIPTGALGGWAPGLRPYQTPQGIAFRVPPKADLVLQVHYHKSGKAETDKTQVGLYLAKEPIEKQVRLAWIVNPMISIPAGDKAHIERKVYEIRSDITLRSLMPHMHLLARSMKAKLVRPDGSQMPLIDVPDWDFNWQLNYALAEPMKVASGSKIVIEATYDNSATNPNNPSNPPRRVGWGEETTDEMFLLIAGYTIDSEGKG